MDEMLVIHTNTLILELISKKLHLRIQNYIERFNHLTSYRDFLLSMKNPIFPSMPSLLLKPRLDHDGRQDAQVTHLMACWRRLAKRRPFSDSTYS